MKTILLLPKKKESEWKPNAHGIYMINGAEVTSLLGAGLAPMVALNDIKYCAEHADGILFSGAPADVNPKRYGEENTHANISDELDELELAFFDAFYQQKKPIMGICRGNQLINVALGGSLYQDINLESLPFHVHKTPDLQRHLVKTEEGSALRELFGAEVMVNSYHHQAVKKPGDGMRITAATIDGVPEAIEHESLPILGFQWHPELTLAANKFNLPDMSPIFDYFAKLCERR